MVYKVVSVEPIITEAIKPIFESTPKFFIISVAIAIEPLPDIGLNNASGITSLGNWIIFKTGFKKFTIASIIPELLSAPIATNNPISVGKILNTISRPSFAPSKKVSNTLFLSIKPNTTIVIDYDKNKEDIIIKFV